MEDLSLTGEAPRKERLSFTGLRVVIAAVVVAGLVFLGDVLDDGGGSGSAPVWPVVRAAEDSCGLAALPIRHAGVVRFSGVCDLERRPTALTLSQARSRERSAKGKPVQRVEQALLNRPGAVVGQVFRGPRILGRCRVEDAFVPLIRCQSAVDGPLPRRVQARLVLKVSPLTCGPAWILRAGFDEESNTPGKTAPVVWRGCGATSAAMPE